MGGRGQPGEGRHWPHAALAVLLLVALVVRIWIVLNLGGHNGDVLVIHRWAERLVEVGPLGFYDGTLALYPLLLYLYWPLGVLFDGEALDLLIKAQSIPFDLALGVLLFAIVRPRWGDRPALAASALYLLNPAVLIAGPMWGQVDAAGSLLYVGALATAARSRWALAGGLAVLAGLAKPQFGLVVLPVAWTVVAAWRQDGRLRPVWLGLLGAVVAYAVVAGPLLLDPLRFADQIYEVGRSKPLLSAGAPNPWGVLFGYEAQDGALFWVGAVLLAVGLALALLPLRRRRDLATLLAVAAFVAFAFYFLPTRVHERYLFPALAVLVPLAVVSWRLFAAYAVLSVAFAASLLAALSRINPPSVAEPLRDLLLTDQARWIMGVTLMGAALAVVWLLGRGGSPQRPGAA